MQYITVHYRQGPGAAVQYITEQYRQGPDTRQTPGFVAIPLFRPGASRRVDPIRSP
jgi:hypothetical protein